MTFLCIRIQPLIVNSGTATAGSTLRTVVDVFSYVALNSAFITHNIIHGIDIVFGLSK